MSLVVDASVALKWVLREPDSFQAEALLLLEPGLLVPDFLLNEAANGIWVQVRRKLFTPEVAREALVVLRSLVEPIPTAAMRLHEAALEIGMAVNHSTYDTLYVAFAALMGAAGVVVADRPFVRTMRTHPDPALAGIVLPLEDWARSARVI